MSMFEYCKFFDYFYRTSVLNMSDFVFYAEVSVGCACVLTLLLYSIKRLPTPQQKFKLFHNLVLWHILYFLSDSVWALVNGGVIPKNVYTVLATNYSNAIVVALLFYSCFTFAEMSTRPEMTRAQIHSLQAKLRIPIFVEMVLLLVLFVLKPNFWLDDKLEPCNLYYFILMFLPFVYIMTVTARCLLRGLKPENRKNIRTYLIVASYTPGCVVAGGLQVFFALTTPIFCFWCTMIILFVYLSLQNQLISTDTLTSLNNRNQLERFLQMPRTSRGYYVVMVDVNHFKQINDTYGHIEGDRALVVVSKALKNACACMGGRSVFLCRYGGDEFLLVVPTETPEYLIRIIRECLREEIENRDERQYYTLQVSIGYSSWDGRISNFRKSVVDADQMMYEDKRST